MKWKPEETLFVDDSYRNIQKADILVRNTREMAGPDEEHPTLLDQSL